jgi:fucose 4-O-acetylase-like acetyltransferase
MLWIVWYHTTCPEAVKHYWHVPIFFFISGTFFRWESSGVFAKKTVKRVFIPFLFFYVISYFYRILLYFWDFREIKSFDYFSIFDIFHWDCCRVDYLSVNVPLWFFISFIIIQFLYWLLYKISTNKWFLAIITVAIFIAGNLLEYYRIALPFMIPQSFLNALYFGMGIVFGKKIIDIMELKGKSICLCSMAIILFIIIMSISIPARREIVTAIQFFPFLIIVFFIFRNVYKLPLFGPLHFYGINSLIVLGAHVPIQIIYRRILFKYLRETNIFSGCIDTILTIITLYFVILFLNKYFPIFVGKRRH